MEDILTRLSNALSSDNLSLDSAKGLGKLGEEHIAIKLEKIASDKLYGITLRNLYLPTGNGRTSEIDLIFITQKGIFVIESKNYSGWIFGSENAKTWTVTYKGGRKEHFYNPVTQNKNHIRHLKKYLGMDIPFYSIIVFSNACEIIDMDIQSKDIYVIYRESLIRTITRICENSADIFSRDSVNDISQRLNPLTKVDKDTKNKHIEDLKTKCPRCGKQLVKRTVKHGIRAGNKFLGCSGFPDCKYTKSLEYSDRWDLDSAYETYKAWYKAWCEEHSKSSE